MSDFARLENKLAKLRQKERAPGEARRLSGNDADSRLAALVTEIDETILPRLLRFETEAGAMILAVANRRLQALQSPAPSGVPEAVLDHPLSDADDPMVRDLGAALRTFLAGDQAVRISASRQTKGFGSDIGVPSGSLARIWEVAEDRVAAPDEILTTFLDGIDTQKATWLRIEGEEVAGQGGADAAIDALGEQAALFLDGYFSKFDVAFSEPTDACGTFIASADPAANAVFFVEIGQLSAIISGPQTAVLQIAADWRKKTAQ